MKLEPGIYHDMPFAEYLQIDAVNNSILKILANKSPAHAKWEMDHPRESTEAMNKGSQLHTLVLEEELFQNHYAVIPKVDRRFKQGKADWANFEQENEGRELVTDVEHAALCQMRDNLLNHPAAGVYFREGKPEEVIVWIDPRTGLICKARIDYLRGAVLCDLKSTKDANPVAFSKDIANFQYDQQAAFYHDGFAELMGGPLSFVFVAAEKTPPFAVACYEAHELLIESGRMAYRPALDMYGRCSKADIWPAYPEPEMINVPDWKLYQLGLSERAML